MRNAKRQKRPTGCARVAVRNGFPDEVLGGLYPFEDRTVVLDDGTSMHYVEMGRAGLRRPTFLLLHGNPTWSLLWRSVVKPLSRVARVVAVDHVGFGRSDHPTRRGYHTVERHVRNLEEFVQRAGLRRVVPVMHDWGGPIGLGWAERHGDDLAGLALLNTWAFVERERLHVPAWYKATRAKGVGELLYGRGNVAIERMLPMGCAKPVPPEVMEGYRHPFPNAQSRAALVAAPRMVPTSDRHPEWAALARIEKALGSLDVPARIVWGEKDPVFPRRFALAFHAALPKAEYPVFLPDAGHFVPEDAPQAVVDQLVPFARIV